MKVKFSNGNKDGMLVYRTGFVGGKECKFTHHNPATGEWWTDDLKDGDEWGRWVPSDKINERREAEG